MSLRSAFLLYSLMQLYSSAAGFSSHSPYVAWTMDNHSRTNLFPRFNSDPRWTGLLETRHTRIFYKGVVGESIYMNATELRLATNLTGSDCIRNLSSCELGLTVAFWINAQSMGHHHTHTIMGTGGFHIAVTNQNLSVCLGNYSYSIKISLLGQGWTHIGIAWNHTRLRVHLNGTEATILGLQVETRLPHPKALAGQLVIGGTDGGSFYLDELMIYYSTLNSEELDFLARPPTTPANGTAMKEHTRVIIMATVIPSSVLIVCLILACCTMKKRRTRESFRNYIHSSSNLAAQNNPVVYSDAAEDHTDIDSEGELERLQHWLIHEEK